MLLITMPSVKELVFSVYSELLYVNWSISKSLKVDLKVTFITAEPWFISVTSSSLLRWLNNASVFFCFVCFFAVAIGILKDKEPGSFIIRDSHSFRGAYGLAMKVATPPPSVLQQSKKSKRMLHISFYDNFSWMMTQLTGQTHNLPIN